MSSEDEIIAYEVISATARLLPPAGMRWRCTVHAHSSASENTLCAPQHACRSKSQQYPIPTTRMVYVCYNKSKRGPGRYRIARAEWTVGLRFGQGTVAEVGSFKRGEAEPSRRPRRCALHRVPRSPLPRTVAAGERDVRLRIERTRKCAVGPEGVWPGVCEEGPFSSELSALDTVPHR